MIGLFLSGSFEDWGVGEREQLRASGFAAC